MPVPRLVGALFALAAVGAAAASPQARWGPVTHFPLARGAGDVRVTDFAAGVRGRVLVGGVAGPSRHPWPVVRERTGARSGWGPLVRLGPGGASAPVIGVNRAGDAVAVFTDAPDGNLMAAYRPAGGVWRAAVPVGAMDGLGLMRLALGEDGRTFLLVSRCTGDDARTCTNTIELRTFASGGGAWERIGAPVVVPTTALLRPAVALSPRGDALIAWLSAYPLGVVSARLRPAGAADFEPAEALSEPGDTPGMPVVALGASGDAIVAWERLAPTVPYAIFTPSAGVSASVRPAGASSWPPARPIGSQRGAVGGVAIDAAGNVAASMIDRDAGGGTGLWGGWLPRDARAWMVSPLGTAGGGDSGGYDEASVTAAAGRGFIHWSIHPGPGDNSTGMFVRGPGAGRWRAADYRGDPTGSGACSEKRGACGYGLPVAVAPDGSAVAVTDMETFQSFDALPYPQAPVATDVGIGRAGRHVTVAFRLPVRARVTATIRGERGGRVLRRSGTWTRPAGARIFTIGPLPAGRRYAVEIEACTTVMGCRTTAVRRILR